jgi:hypothetical protein
LCTNWYFLKIFIRKKNDESDKFPRNLINAFLADLRFFSLPRKKTLVPAEVSVVFSKNRSGVPFLKIEMPRVLMPGETYATTAVEKQEAFSMVRQAMEEIMARHNTAFLNSFRQMMVGVFGPSVDKHFERAQGPTG